MINPKILIIDDDPALLKLLRERLSDLSDKVETCSDGRLALKMISNSVYTLIILDNKLPSIEGMMLLKHIRDKSPQTKSIMITGSLNKEDEIAAYRNGAIVFHPKPINLELLLTQAYSVLSYNKGDGVHTLKIAEFELDTKRRKITGMMNRNNNDVQLSKAELSILMAIINSNGETLSREELLRLSVGHKRDKNLSSIDTLICRLRDKLKRVGAQKIIKTDHGNGYRLGE